MYIYIYIYIYEGISFSFKLPRDEAVVCGMRQAL